MAEEVRLAFEGSDKVVRLSPPFYVGLQDKYSATDLGKIAAQGNGVYGLQEQQINPFKAAPPQEPIGGVIYFGNDIKRDDFFALTRILGIVESHHPDYANKYAAYYVESQFTMQDGFLCQLRTVDAFGLRYHFGEINEWEFKNYPAQELSRAEAYWAFIEEQKKRWGTGWWDSPELDGKFGGDGDYAREELSFGLMLENNYHGISRIWSRAWLVTK